MKKEETNIERIKVVKQLKLVKEELKLIKEDAEKSEIIMYYEHLLSVTDELIEWLLEGKQWLSEGNDTLFDKDIKMAMNEEDDTVIFDGYGRGDVENVPVTYTPTDIGDSKNDKSFEIYKWVIRGFEQYGREFGTLEDYENAILGLMGHREEKRDNDMDNEEDEDEDENSLKKTTDGFENFGKKMGKDIGKSIFN